ncbi:hypothetical protein ACDX78_10255 [Virgibacillus oceani]
MAELSRFFNSVAGDERTYQANDFAQFFINFLGDGFFDGLATSSSNSMNITIQPGSAFIQGHEYTNTASFNLTHDTASATNDRIDRIVLRLNRDIDVRSIRAFIKKGSEGSNPEPPELTRNDYVWEISLAQVWIEAGKSFIDDSQITDERGDPDACGRVRLTPTVSSQLDSVDIYSPQRASSAFDPGVYGFRLHGENNGDELQEWMNSIGISPSDYGRGLSNLRARVDLNIDRAGSGVQTFTVFDWSQNNDYQVYGKFSRQSNTTSSSSIWGRWQEEIMVFDKGRHGNNHWVQYTDGSMEYHGVIDLGNIAIDSAIGSSDIWRADDNFVLPLDKNFEEIHYFNIFPREQSVFNIWAASSSTGSSTPSFRVLSTTNHDSARVVLGYFVKGRWR